MDTGFELYHDREELNPLDRAPRAADHDLARATDKLSPARRVRRTFAVLGCVAAIVLFVVLANAILVPQAIDGHAGPLFMLGTACVIAGACLLLFAIILAIGVALSFALSEEPRP